MFGNYIIRIDVLYVGTERKDIINQFISNVIPSYVLFKSFG